MKCYVIVLEDYGYYVDSTDYSKVFLTYKSAKKYIDSIDEYNEFCIMEMELKI